MVASVAMGFVLAPAAFAGAGDSVSGWIWSGTAGWISLNCTNPQPPDNPSGTCATVDYGVNMSSAGGGTAVADITGYAWSETVGWICFGTTCGVAPADSNAPEGVKPYALYRASHAVGAETMTDQLWGWARVLSLGNEGWISLNCANPLPGRPDGDCAASQYFVGLNALTRDFNQEIAVYDHFAWSGTDAGTGLGWIDFSLAHSDWAPASLGVISRPPGIVEPPSFGSLCSNDDDCDNAPHLRCDTSLPTPRCVIPGTHVNMLEITFSGFSAAKDNWLECEVLMSNGSRRVFGKVLPVNYSKESTALVYAVDEADPAASNQLWYITACRLAGPRKAAVCANDAACGAGAICEEQDGVNLCRDVIVSSERVRPIYSHPPVWTGLGAAEDQFAAIMCNAGFPDNYFRNAAQCDFTADASFALSMRRGVPLERDCNDGIDNDGNNQADCDDRYCKGISYLCADATLPRTLCTWRMPNDNVDDCDQRALGAGLCCSNQPERNGAALSHIVDGLECREGDPKDGYFDCSCDSSRWNASSTDDCYAPGAAQGDLCCDAESNVIKL
jgi:hypothetical protein